MLLQVYCRMSEAEELEHYGPEFALLSAYFKSLQEPTTVLYAERDGVIWFVAWLDVTQAGVNYACWLAPEERRSRLGLRAILASLQEAFALGRTVVVMTRSERLLREYRRMGFVRAGELPALAPDQTEHIWYLTAEAFAATVARYARHLQVAA
jgi:RimJ/RimL family protein N-acetyltransferase